MILCKNTVIGTIKAGSLLPFSPPLTPLFLPNQMANLIEAKTETPVFLHKNIIQQKF